MDFYATRGLGDPWSGAMMDPTGFWRPTSIKYKADKRLNPPKVEAVGEPSVLSGARILRHPFLDPIVYPRVPDETVNFARHPLRRMRTVVTKTITSSGIARYPDALEDVVIFEIWKAQTASTLEQLFHAFYSYWIQTLPEGRYLGWQPRDLSPKCYLVHLLDVRLGQDENLPVAPQGAVRPYLLKETLSVSLKIVGEGTAPASAVAMGGL